jgi:hypothetical protein
MARAREARLEVTSKEIEALSERLKKFAEGLSDKERAVLTGVLVMAGRQLQEESSPGVQLGDVPAFQASFARAFDKFAPGAFGPFENKGGLAAGTVCIE